VGLERQIAHAPRADDNPRRTAPLDRADGADPIGIHELDEPHPSSSFI
jgi:hypothetical protein